MELVQPAGYFFAQTCAVPVRYLENGSMKEQTVPMLMVQAYNGRVFFFPTSDKALGQSILPTTCFVFNAKMRFSVAQVGHFRLCADQTVKQSMSLVIHVFEGFSIVYDGLTFDIGTHDFYSSLASNL